VSDSGRETEEGVGFPLDCGEDLALMSLSFPWEPILGPIHNTVPFSAAIVGSSEVPTTSTVSSGPGSGIQTWLVLVGTYAQIWLIHVDYGRNQHKIVKEFACN